MVIYKCDTCDENFDRLSSLDKHKKNKFGCEKGRKKNKKLKKYICKFCDKECSRCDSLKRHVDKCKENPKNNQLPILNIVTAENNNFPIPQLQPIFLLSDNVRLLPYDIGLDLFTLSTAEVNSILLSNENPLLKYFKLTHCNLERPNYLNIYYISENCVSVFTENG